MSSTVSKALDFLKPERRVFLGGCFGEPAAFLAALAADPGRASGVTFTGAFVPSVNRHDVASLAPDAQVETFFLTPEMAESFARGQVRFLPLHYSAIVRRLAAGIDIGVVRVSPPNAAGDVSFGVAADFAPLVLATGATMVAEIDAGMPFVANGPTAPLARFALAYEAAGDPKFDSGAPSPLTDAIGGNIAARIPDGATLQIGLGKIHGGLLRALSGRRGLAYHGGMIIDETAALIDSGVFTSATTGVALGTGALLQRCREDTRLAFRTAARTHDFATLSNIPRFVSVNAALAVDLFGASVSDVLDGRQVSGSGGLMDFHRGAHASPDGVPCIALAATSGDGARSRIVPALPEGTPATVARTDCGLVATEHGAVDCRGLDLDARAEALISIAAPEHRRGLMDAWDGMRRRATRR